MGCSYPVKRHVTDSVKDCTIIYSKISTSVQIEDESDCSTTATLQRRVATSTGTSTASVIWILTTILPKKSSPAASALVKTRYFNRPI